MKVLVTGGAGYIGTELVRRLAGIPEIDRLIVYDNLSRGCRALFTGPPPRQGNRILFLKKDLLDTRSLRKALDGVDVVYHLGAVVTTPFAESNAQRFEQVNHWGTAELSYLVEEVKPGRVIYASSTSVYGAQEEEATEEDQPRPVTHYGLSKLRGEEFLSRLDLPVYILRLGNVYGPSDAMRFDSVINRLVFQANYQRFVHVRGDGSQFRPFIHIDSLVDTLTALLKADLPAATYNLVENNWQIIELYRALAELLPKVEMSYLDQQFKHRSLKVRRNETLAEISRKRVHTLSDDLKAFIQKLSFYPAPEEA